MKTANLYRIGLVCLLWGLSLQAIAQQKIKRSDLPPRIFSKFVRLFPNDASQRTTVWEKQDKNYSISFEKKGQKNTATLDANGNLLAMRAAIRLDQLPNPVFCYLEENYRRYFEDSALRNVDAKGNENYEVVVFRYENDKTTLVFDEKGKFLQNKTKK